jgi:hypothetical protein
MTVNEDGKKPALTMNAKSPQCKWRRALATSGVGMANLQLLGKKLSHLSKRNPAGLVQLTLAGIGPHVKHLLRTPVAIKRLVMSRLDQPLTNDSQKHGFFRSCLIHCYRDFLFIYRSRLSSDFTPHHPDLTP